MNGSKINAGSTIPRAPPGAAISSVIEQHGLNSPQVTRAYASTTEADGSPSYVPVPHSYWNVTSSKFSLRSGTNYKKNKEKSPSGEALYDLYCFDFIDLPHTLHNVEDIFEVPDIPGVTDIETGHDAVPPMFVVMTNLPRDEPKMMGNTSDGATIVSVFYYVISEATLEALKDLQNAPPAVKLFVQWCKKSETDAEFRGRFKAMAILDEIKKLGLPSFISGYNGKPVLINKSGRMKRHKNYIEMSVNVFLFHYVAKKSLNSLKPKFPTFVLNIGFTIEGRSDEELPEVLLGGCRLVNIDPLKAKKV